MVDRETDSPNPLVLKEPAHLSSRRSFLKKAVAGGAALSALYVVPRFSSVGAKPAYASITGIDPCPDLVFGFSIANDILFEPTETLTGPETAADYYNFDPATQTANPAFGPEANTGFFWLWEDSNTGDISLGMIFNSPVDPTGGFVGLSFAGTPVGVTVDLTDDLFAFDPDFLSSVEGQWFWDSGTDGGVLGGFENQQWEITISLAPETFGVSTWYFLSGSGDSSNPNRIELDMNIDLKIRSIATGGC